MDYLVLKVTKHHYPLIQIEEGGTAKKTILSLPSSISFMLFFELYSILSLRHQRIITFSVSCEAGLTTEHPLTK